MKAFLKILFVSFGIFILPIKLFSCGYFPNECAYRITCFDGNFKNYIELNNYILHTDYLNGDIINERYKWKDNIEQWQKYCNNKNINLEDIYTALYGGRSLSINHNSFIAYIKESKPEAYSYLQKLLNLENSQQTVAEGNKTVFKENWDCFAERNYCYTEREMSTISPESDISEYLEALTNCKDPFIKKRWAYQCIVLAYYQNNFELVKKLFNQYFTRTNRTWIDNSAQHYLALVSENKDELLLECVIHGYDKLSRNIELLSYSENFNNQFATTLNDTTRSYYYFVKSLKEYGRGLSYLELVYELHPQNKYFDFLLNREINKIENWILKNKIISDKRYYEWQQEYTNNAEPNLASDLAYTREFLMFLLKIRNKTLMQEMLIVYTEHLLGIKNYTFNPEKYKNIPNQYVQARVIDFIINFEQKTKDGKYKKDILYIFDNVSKIDKNEGWYYNLYDEELNGQSSTYMVQQLARQIGKLMINSPKYRTEGWLLIAKSGLPVNNWNMGFYMNLYEAASPEECLDIVNLLNQKTDDKYVQFLQKDNINHYKVHYCTDYKGSPKGEYDKIKILDISAQKYVKEGKYENAIAIYNKFPTDYWVNTCNEMPFIINIYNVYIPCSNQPKIYFNKLTFLKQFNAYLNHLKKDPDDPLINYYVANAYFSITQEGGMWYITCPYNSYERIQDDFYNKTIDKVRVHLEKTIANSTDKALTSTALLTLYQINEIDKKTISNRNKNLLEDITNNCDLYQSYLHNLSGTYSSAFNSPKLGILQKFQHFDNPEYGYY